MASTSFSRLYQLHVLITSRVNTSLCSKKRRHRLMPDRSTSRNISGGPAAERAKAVIGGTAGKRWRAVVKQLRRVYKGSAARLVPGLQREHFRGSVDDPNLCMLVPLGP